MQYTVYKTTYYLSTFACYLNFLKQMLRFKFSNIKLLKPTKTYGQILES